MSSIIIYVLMIGIPFVVFFFFYRRSQSKKAVYATETFAEAEASGLTVPASLHPKIDPNKCLGCATCVDACPEGKIIGVIKRKAVLISPTSCIGHGAFKEACPTQAIELVFGTETRGVEIPSVTPDFQTNVQGLYIAGELGGMGLIRNAIAQGKQSIQSIAKANKKSHSNQFDVVIVGAGPAGMSAALTAQEKKLKYVILEQDTIGGTVAHYPRGKIVMTQPAELPIVGKFQFREASKEQLMEFWTGVVKQTKLAIKTGARVDHIEKTNDGFVVETPKGKITTNNVLLTMGRRGTPRKLGVPGEEMSKVVYRLTDPEQYKGNHVLVVGGGDSALEAALAISDEKDTKTTLSYRSPSFSRAKKKNRDKIDTAVANGKINLLLESNVISISEDKVAIDTKTGSTEIDNDAIIVCAGGILPTPFLKKIGINVEEKFGTA